MIDNLLLAIDEINKKIVNLDRQLLIHSRKSADFHRALRGKRRLEDQRLEIKLELADYIIGNREKFAGK